MKIPWVNIRGKEDVASQSVNFFTKETQNESGVLGRNLAANKSKVGVQVAKNIFA